MTDTNHRRPKYLLAAAGAVGGAVLGCLAFYFLLTLGFYGMVLPGALIGLGCGAQSAARSNAVGVAAALLALIVSLLTEWHFFPFLADNSLSYFLAHLGDLKTMTMLTIAAGVFAGFWFGRGR